MLGPVDSKHILHSVPRGGKWTRFQTKDAAKFPYFLVWQWNERTAPITTAWICLCCLCRFIYICSLHEVIKPEGRGFTQPLTEMSTRSIKIMFLGSKAAAGAKGWQPYRHLWADCLDTVGSLTSYNPIGLHGLYGDSFYTKLYRVYLVISSTH
jgi:hypothetical protein